MRSRRLVPVPKQLIYLLLLQTPSSPSCAPALLQALRGQGPGEAWWECDLIKGFTFEEAAITHPYTIEEYFRWHGIEDLKEQWRFWVTQVLRGLEHPWSRSSMACGFMECMAVLQERVQAFHAGAVAKEAGMGQGWE